MMMNNLLFLKNDLKHNLNEAYLFDPQHTLLTLTLGHE